MMKESTNSYPNISYAIPVCNEHAELDRLLKQINDFVDKNDEIVIQYDAGNTTDDVYGVVETFAKSCRCTLKQIEFALDGNFAEFKNNLKSHCEKDYVFQIDADEFLGDGLLMHLPLLLKENADVDLFYIPRINIVTELTEEYAKSQNWRVEQITFPVAKNYNYQVINYPDVQGRLMKNLPAIKWNKRVHEVIVGANSYMNLGNMEVTSDFQIEDVQNWCLIHIKSLQRQQKQNEFYEKLI